MLALPAIPLVRRATPAGETKEGRADGRSPDQLRQLKLRTGVVSSASGSALIEMAHTKVLCSVFGPHATEGHDWLEQGRLECSLRFATFARRAARRERQLAGGSAEERTLSHEMAAALSASVQLHLLPKSTIAVHALVLQDDGSALPAAIACASLALADASIVLYDLVAACGCALRSDRPPALDPTAAELGGAGGSLALACMPTLDHVTLLREEGATPYAQMTEALQLTLSGCGRLHDEMTAALRKGAGRGVEPTSSSQGERALGDGGEVEGGEAL